MERPRVSTARGGSQAGDFLRQTMNLPAFQGQGDKSAKSGGYTLEKGKSQQQTESHTDVSQT